MPDIAISSFFADTSGDLGSLVSSITQGKTAWYTNNGDDTFKEHVVVSDIASITLDVNVIEDENTIELVTAEIQSGDVAVYSLENGTIAKEVIHNANVTYGVAFGDIDDNGTADVLSAHYRPSKLDIIYRDQHGHFGTAINVGEFGDGVTAAAIIDINDDGYKDAITAIFNDNIFVSWRSKSYQDCIVTSDATINLTANFSSIEVPIATSNSVSDTNSKSSSGGAVSILLLFMVVIRLLFTRR